MNIQKIDMGRSNVSFGGFTWFSEKNDELALNGAKRWLGMDTKELPKDVYNITQKAVDSFIKEPHAEEIAESFFTRLFQFLGNN